MTRIPLSAHPAVPTKRVTPDRAQARPWLPLSMMQLRSMCKPMYMLTSAGCPAAMPLAYQVLLLVPSLHLSTAGPTHGQMLQQHLGRAPLHLLCLHNLLHPQTQPAGHLQWLHLCDLSCIWGAV